MRPPDDGWVWSTQGTLEVAIRLFAAASWKGVGHTAKHGGSAEAFGFELTGRLRGPSESEHR
ncbi:hypothetical protein K5549_001473 [Capra hircus]|uniref:Uncharacterized protein n=1 Tax=Capra hircus TaxID=9925 RepID=A0A452EET6_CAPHI|nr:hypothetical protein K5549_001473 [Capra hircus]